MAAKISFQSNLEFTGVARTVPNSHVIVFCSISLVFSQFGVLRTVNGAAPVLTDNEYYHIVT